MKINDIDLSQWQDYENIETGSLWLIPKRDTSGAHSAGGSFHGNFVPQIPNQLIQRYTKAGDVVVDPFLGGGTTAIEARRLGRKVIGIDLNPLVVGEAIYRIRQEDCSCGTPQATTSHKPPCCTQVLLGDSAAIDLAPPLERFDKKSCQLVIMHPPYHDIIKFSDPPIDGDLSHADDVEHFLIMFGAVVENMAQYLDKGRYLAVVVGDKYSGGEWIPLGFKCMEEVLSPHLGFKLKSIVVKDFNETKGKANQQALWRYRALAGGFYVFRHEYILIFQKK